MAIRPAFQFYPADWRNNAKLRRCTEAARGAWIDVLCILHDSDEYGVLRWPLVDIAQSAGVPLALVDELVRKEVLKGADENADDFIYRPKHGGKEGEPVTLVTADGGPCWYSSRFVKDEYVRQRRGASTRFDSDNNPNKGAGDGLTDRQRLRVRVFAKTGGRCFHCERVLEMEEWDIDHHLPKAKGGTNDFSNLVPACVECNQDKGDTHPADWGSPTRRLGVRQGDGASSSSSSSKSKSKSADPPAAAFDFRADLFARWKAMPGSGGGAFLSKLFKDYKPEQRVIEAVEHAMSETRADPKAFVIGKLKAKPGGVLDDDLDSALAIVRAQDFSGCI